MSLKYFHYTCPNCGASAVIDKFDELRFTCGMHAVRDNSGNRLLTACPKPPRKFTHTQFADELERARERHDLMLRSVAAMAIAEGDEGHEKLPRDCPMLTAVGELRDRYDAAMKLKS